MKIIYTYTDEAPALATYSFLPVIEAFARSAGFGVETRDISLAGRILAQFPERLTEEQRIPDELTELGELARTPEANIIKLPNISASIPQLKAAIAELQDAGYDIPDYPDEPSTRGGEGRPRRATTRSRARAVNPVLREGNSDRRAPASVKQYARKHPHSMGAWSPRLRGRTSRRWPTATSAPRDSRSPCRRADTRAHRARRRRRRRHGPQGQHSRSWRARSSTPRSCACGARRVPRRADRGRARPTGVLFSLHLKATMMKVSDPIIFGHGVRAFFPEVFEKHADALARARRQSRTTDWATSSTRDSTAPRRREGRDRGRDHSRLRERSRHRDGRLRPRHHQPARPERRDRRRVDAGDDPHVGPDVEQGRASQQDTKAVIPDSLLRHHLRGDDRRLQRARRVRSGDDGHDAERRAHGAEGRRVRLARQDVRDRPRAGTVRVVDAAGNDAARAAPSRPGDILRACQTKDAPIQRLGQAGGVARAGDRRARRVLARRDARPRRRAAQEGQALPRRATTPTACRSRSWPVAEATRFTLERARRGEDTISVTGNVLRDYLTDLFPILELGTSAKMLSIVPLMNGGGLFETGAGGSAPKHVQQFVAARTTCAGTRSASSSRWPCRSSTSPSADDNPQAKVLADDAGPGDRHAAGEGQVAVAPRRRARQPRQPLLPRAVLGAGAGRADRGSGARARVRAARGGAGRQRGDDRRRAERGAGRAGRPRRLLLRSTASKADEVMRPSATFNRAIDALAVA